MPKFFFALLAFLLAIPAVAAEIAVSLPGHDDLVLEVRSGWVARISRPRADLPPTITVGPNSGNAFQVLITPLWPMGNAKSPTLGEIRSLVEGGARQALPQAVEQSLPLKELTGSSTNGYYFSATDRQPEPDGYKYLTQGAVMLKELRITFTILVNGEPQKPTEQALEVLQTARRAPARNAT
jgi:hypothetical protein